MNTFKERAVRAPPTPLGTLFATPWARFWAKALDLTLWGLLVTYVFDLIVPSLLSAPQFQGTSGVTLSTLIILPFAMLVDAVVQGTLGATPGSVCAGFRVETIDHQRPPIRLVLRRNLLIYFRCLCAGIPLLSLFTLYNAYRVALAGKLSSWDEALFTRPFSHGGSVGRTTMTAAVTIGVRVLAFLITPLLSAGGPATP